MDYHQWFTQIDFCFRAKESDVHRSNDPKGYWFITKIFPADKAEVWRKRTSGDWIRIANPINDNDAESIKLGNLIKHPSGTAYASGRLHQILDNMLFEYMSKENKKDYPYYYWGKVSAEEEGLTPLNQYQ